MLLPFDSVFGINGLGIVIIWSVLLGILWLRTQNPMLVGIVGASMAGAYMSTELEEIPFEFQNALVIGGVLFAIALGIALYQLISTRILQPPT